MKKTPIKAVDIIFNNHSIEYVTDITPNKNNIIITNVDIKNKDLILKTSYTEDNVVSFTTVIATPEYYMNLLHDKNTEKLKNIYIVGDIIGFIIEL